MALKELVRTSGAESQRSSCGRANRMPFALEPRSCESTVVLGSGHVARTAYHIAEDASVHARTQTDPKRGEACSVCHGPDGAFSVDSVHAPTL